MNDDSGRYSGVLSCSTSVPSSSLSFTVDLGERGAVFLISLAARAFKYHSGFIRSPPVKSGTEVGREAAVLESSVELV